MAFPVNPVNGQQATVNGVAYIWDSAIPAWVVFTSTAADFSGNNLAVTHNITSATLTALGNVTGANFLTAGLVSATGNITGAYILGNGSQLTGIDATSIQNGTSNVRVANNGNVTVGIDGTSNVGVFTTTGLSVTGEITATGNVNANNVSTGIVSASGNIVGNNFVGNLSGGLSSDLTVNNYVIKGGNYGGITLAMPVGFGANLAALYEGGVTLAAGTGGTTAGRLILDETGNISASGNVTVVGNVTAGNVSATLVTGTLTTSAQPNVTSLGTLTSLSVTGNVIAGNLSVVGVTADTGNIIGGNLLTGGLISATGNLTAGNVSATLITGTLTTNAQPNVTSVGTLSSLSVTGDTQIANLQTTGNAIIGGNLIVNGNTTYINIVDLNVQDPLISLGGGANGDPLTTNDGKDRGVLDEYYTTAPQTAWMGYKNSTGNLVAADNVTVSNNIVTVNSYGVFQVGQLYAGSNILTTGNIDSSGNLSVTGNAVVSGNIITGNITANLYGWANTVTDNAQPNITSTGILTSLSVTGNVTGGNVRTGIVSASGNITGGNVSATNLSGSLTTAAQANITSVGVLTSVSVTGNVTSGNVTTVRITATGNIATSANLSVTGNTNIVGNLYVTGNVFANISNVSGNAGVFYGDASGFGALYAGIASGYVYQPDTVAQFSADTNEFAQINLQNINSGNSASTDIVATADSGDNYHFYVDMGIASSSYDGLSANALGTILHPNDAFLYTVGNAANGTTDGGNLVIATATPDKSIKLATGGTDSDIVLQLSAGNASVFGNVSASGNIYGDNFSTAGNISANYISGSGNITGGNVLTGGLISSTGNLTANNVTAGLVTGTLTTAAQPNITSIGTLSNVTVTGNTQSGNLLTAGQVSATGNIQGNVFIGNGAGLTNLNAGNIVGLYGNSNVAAYLPTYTGNLGNVNSITASGNIYTAARLIGASGNYIQPNFVQPNSTDTNWSFGIAGDGTTNFWMQAQFNGGSSTQGFRVYDNNSLTVPFSVDGTGNTNVNGNLSVSGNVTVDYISATGNISSGNLITGNVSATGNIDSGNVATGNVSVSGNIIGANVISAQTITATGNILGAAASLSGNTQSGNLLTSGYLSATGNIQGNYVLGNGAFLSGVITSVANINNGTSNISVYNNGNITVGVSGVGNTVVFTPTGIEIDSAAGNVVYTTGNIAGGYFFGNGALLSGIVTTVSNISNGTSNIVAYNTGNIAVSVSGVGNTVVFTPTATDSTVDFSTTGNITGSYLFGNGSQLVGVAATSIGVLPALTVTGNITGGNLAINSDVSITGNLTIGANLNVVNVNEYVGATGNISFLGNLLPATAGNTTYDLGLPDEPWGNIYVTNFSTAGNFTTSNLLATVVSAAGNITGGNLRTVGNALSNFVLANGAIFNNNVTVTGTITGVLVGNASYATLAGTVVTGAQPNITSIGTLTSLSVTGNVTGGNLTTTGIASLGGFTIDANTITSQGPTLTIDPNASGGIDGEVVIQGNLVVNGNMTYINSNNITTNDLTINMANNAATATAANGGGIGVGPAGSEYISLTYNSASNIWVASNGLSVQGAVQAQANVAAANIVTGGLVTATGNIYGNVFVGNGAGLTNINAGNIVGAYGNANVAEYLPTYSGNIGGTLTTNAQPYITSVGTLTSLSVTGNIIAGNLSVVGVTADTGNITAGNLLTSGRVSATGNAYAANVNIAANGGVTFTTNPSTLTFGDVPVTNRYYVDATRTDTYTQNGSQSRPFKTIAGAQAAIATAISGGLNPEVEPVYIIVLSNVTEDVTLSTNHVYLVGQNGQIHQPIILSGNVTVQATSGTLNSNHFSISGIEIVGGTNGKAIYVTGTFPTRLSLQDVWITANGTGAGLYQDNTGTGTYTHGGPLKVSHNGSGDVYCFDIRKGVASFEAVETSGATQVGAAGPGATLTFNNSQLDANGDVVVETYGSGVLVVTNSVIKNSAANSFGIKLNAVANVAGTVSVGQSAFNVPLGTGQAVWLDPNTTPGLSGVFAWSGASFYPSTNTTISPTVIPGPLAILVGTQISPIFYGDITSYAVAQDWDLIDNNTSALSFDTTGKTGVLELVTTNSAEGVKMSGYLSVTGNVTGGNLTLATATGNITGHDITLGGNAAVTGFVSAAGNVYTPRVQNGSTGVYMDAGYPGYITFSNGTGQKAIIDDAGNLSVVGNITGSYILGNGSQLTGLSANSIGNVGNCSVVANTPDGNVNISADGVANLATFNLGTMTMLGAYANPNQIDIAVSVVGNVNGMMVGPIAFGPSGNIQIPDSSRIIIL